MKILNIDNFASKEKRVLTIAGVDYPVEEMSVENFIQTTRAAEKLSGEESVATQVEATIEMICRSVPGIDNKMLTKLSLSQLQTIVTFVRGEEVEGTETTEEEQEGEVKK